MNTVRFIYLEQSLNKKHVMGIHWCTSPTRCEAALTRWASELLHTGTPSEQVMVNSFMIPDHLSNVGEVTASYSTAQIKAEIWRFDSCR